MSFARLQYGTRRACILPGIAELRDSLSQRKDTSPGIRAGTLDHVDRVLIQWASVRPDLETTPLAFVARLGRAAAFVDAGVTAKLAEFGLTREAFDVLASLRRAGPPFRLSPTELYVGLMRSSGAMTHRLAQLEDARLVRRVADPEDRRGLLVELTRRGRALVDTVAPQHLENERRLISALTTREQKQFIDLLRKLLISFEAASQTPPRSGRGGRRKTARRSGR